MDAKKLVLTALLAAVVTVTTMVVNIPLPRVQGYVNVGDTVVLVAGLLFGPAVGALAGAIGSSAADLLLGYALWAPWTFVIKGVEGFLAGWLLRRFKKAAPSAGAAALAMVGGYFLVSCLLYGVGAALASLPGDLIQGSSSVLLSLVLFHPLRKQLTLQG